MSAMPIKRLELVIWRRSSRWLDSGVKAQKSSSRQRILIVMDAGQTGFRVGAAKYARFGLALNNEKSRLVVTAVNTLAGNLRSFWQTSLRQSTILKAFEKHFNHSRGNQAMSLAQEVKKKAKEVGFAVVGISNLGLLRDLPYGNIRYIGELPTPEAELPTVKSVIVMGLYAWDIAFNIVANSWRLHNDETRRQKVPLESYQLYYQVVKSKAWEVAHYLHRKGFDSVTSVSIPLKTAAVKCGLGCQGKNTLLVTPTHGPRVRLVAVLTEAELDADEPYQEDLCKDCERCVRACPAKAIEPYKVKVNRCMVYASENPDSKDIPVETRSLEQRLTQRPTPNSFFDCSACLEACPIGKSIA